MLSGEGTRSEDGQFGGPSRHLDRQVGGRHEGADQATAERRGRARWWPVKAGSRVFANPNGPGQQGRLDERGAGALVTREAEVRSEAMSGLHKMASSIPPLRNSPST